MALFIPGMVCALCGREMRTVGEIVAFAPFVKNRIDPMFMFNDGVFHLACFRAHPLSRAAGERYREFREHVGPARRACAVCSKQIADPDDYFAFGYLTDEVENPCYRLNYIQLHRSCLASWSELGEAINNLESLVTSGKWRAEDLGALIGEMRNASS